MYNTSFITPIYRYKKKKQNFIKNISNKWMFAINESELLMLKAFARKESVAVLWHNRRIEVSV